MHVCMYVYEGVLKRLEEEDLDEGVRRRLKDSSETPGALWHIYLNRDMDKMQEFLHKVNTLTRAGCTFMFNYPSAHLWSSGWWRAVLTGNNTSLYPANPTPPSPHVPAL